MDLYLALKMCNQKGQKSSNPIIPFFSERHNWMPIMFNWSKQTTNKILSKLSRLIQNSDVKVFKFILMENLSTKEERPIQNLSGDDFHLFCLGLIIDGNCINPERTISPSAVVHCCTMSLSGIWMPNIKNKGHLAGDYLIRLEIIFTPTDCWLWYWWMLNVSTRVSVPFSIWQ